MPRLFRSTQPDATLHVIGNGQLLAYGRGPELAHLFGPPYSSPDLLQLTLVAEVDWTGESQRLEGSGAWSHTLSAGPDAACRFTDAIHPERPIFVRHFDFVAEFGPTPVWRILPHSSAQIAPLTRERNGLILSLERGGLIYTYPTILDHWVGLLPRGGVRLTLGSAGYQFELSGPGELFIVAANDWPSLHDHLTFARALTAPGLLALSLKADHAFEAARLARCSRQNLPPEIEAAAQNVAFLIRAQQSADGGLIAGAMYPLAYLRDQYGTARGMLALGMLPEVEHNMEFRRIKFSRLGSLLNAESMGTDCARHQHENDDVEGPGFTILQAREMQRAGFAPELLRSLWPMLEWCWRAQCCHLAGGLLPFNGDETYVAGGFYPRSGLLQGSADATLVFAEAGLWLSEWARCEGFWSEAEAAAARQLAERANTAWRTHFFRDGEVYANAPARETLVVPPPFRHGVCENREHVKFGWLGRSPEGHYLCPACLAKGIHQATPAPAPMVVRSVALLPAWLGSTILGPTEIKQLIDRMLADQASPSEWPPSVPGHPGFIGYDPGLLLWNMTKIRDVRTAGLRQRMMGLCDGAGVWAEYYDDTGQPYGCRARPWESGINIEAVLATFTSA